MKLNIEAMKKTMKMLFENTYLTMHTKEQILEYVNEYSSLDVFDEKAKQELSEIFWNTIEPMYNSYSNGEHIPNIFEDISAQDDNNNEEA